MASVGYVKVFFFLFLAPHPDRRGAVRLKLQVEIAVLGNSPCEIAVLRFKNGDFTRGIVDFGDFNPYFGRIRPIGHESAG